MKKYDVIIVNYNGEKIISDCLNSIFASSMVPNKVIIYDNNSKDDSIKLIKKNFPKVFLIEGKKNIGFGNGNNMAMKYSESKYILFMNNDVILDKKCAEKLLEDIRYHRVAISNPIIYRGWNKNSTEIYSFGAEMNQIGFGYGLYDHTKDRADLNCFSAACFMVRSEVIKKLQFEKSFFMYYEEPDISVRILKNKLRIGRIKAAKCYHLESYSSPKKISDGVSFRQYYGVQNRWFMIGKYWPLHLFFKTLILNLLHLLYILFYCAKNKKILYLKLAYLAPINMTKGLCARNSHDTIDKYWYKKLTKTSLRSYRKLEKKVFVKT